MMPGPNKRTIWARRNRGVFDDFTGCKVQGKHLDRLRYLAKRLNVDVSDLLRAFIEAMASLPQKPEEIGANMAEIKSSGKVNPPSKSYNEYYV